MLDQKNQQIVMYNFGLFHRVIDMYLDKPDAVKDVSLKIKSLQQKINPITIGTGAYRPYIYVIFDKEAAHQFSRGTMVYLSWIHQGTKKIKGYNAFEQISEKPNCWMIHLPSSMLNREGTVLARLELVDKKSVAASTNFEINILSNPNAEETFTESDDYDLFHQAIIELTDKIEKTETNIKETQQSIEDLNNLFNQVQEFYEIIVKEREEQNLKIDQALSNSYESLTIAIEALNQLAWGSVN